MTARTCPSCSRRWAQLIDPDCAVCAGSGVLELGQAALHRHPAEVASRAVEFALESAARDAMVRGQMHPGEARRVLADTVGALRTAGVLGKSAPGDAGRRRFGTPQVELREQAFDIATDAAGVAAGPEDWRALSQPPHLFDPDDRPLSEPGLPGFSAGGFVAYLARVADPVDPLTTSTRAVQSGRLVADRQARGLQSAALEAAARKAKAQR